MEKAEQIILLNSVSFFNRKFHNLKEFLVKMQLFVQEWSINEKLLSQSKSKLIIKQKIEGELIAKDKKFIESARALHLLCYPWKGIESETPADTLLLLLNRNELPLNMEDFRIINKEEKTCDAQIFIRMVTANIL